VGDCFATGLFIGFYFEHAGRWHLDSASGGAYHCCSRTFLATTIFVQTKWGLSCAVIRSFLFRNNALTRVIIFGLVKNEICDDLLI